jgi:3-deoxy-D-manno-octulosonic-acid transferase
LHAVSVGEMRVASLLVRQIQQHYPGRPILISCMTPTGRATAGELFGDMVRCVYLPYDFQFAHRRLIATFAPQVLLILETEIWPNLLAACQGEHVPALLVNARLSEKSLRAYMRFAPVRALARGALQCMRTVAAQSPADAGRLRTLGAVNPQISGNIKFDMTVDAAQLAKGESWRSGLAKEKHILLAASTREGEEALLLDAYCRTFSAAERAKMLLVLVPRHPQRFTAVETLIRARELAMRRRSADAPDDQCAVWLGDSMGEMAAYMAMCDVAFIGGSLLPLGGQNLIEACAQGKPVIMGPSTFNFAEASRLAIEAGAMRQANHANDVMAMAKSLFDDEAARITMGAAARAFAVAHAGATEKTMALIAPLIAHKPNQRR